MTMIEVKYNVLPNYDRYEQELWGLHFETKCDPNHGVDTTGYPGISTDLPIGIERHIDAAVKRVIPKGYECSLRFARKSGEGISKPNDVHTDAELGDYTAILYCHTGNGTSFVRSKTNGSNTHPATDQEMVDYQVEKLDRSRWWVDTYVEAYPNKLVVFDSGLYHRSEPEATELVDRLVVVSIYKRRE